MAGPALTELEDEALMLAYQRGNVRAFDEILRRHQRPVFNFLLRSVNNKSIAEDLLQEVFLRLVKSAASYKKEAKLTTWMYTIARNLCIDHARRQKHRRAASLDQPLGKEKGGSTLGATIPDERPGVERQVSSKRLQQRISEAIESLSEEQREVFLMRQRSNLQFNEIAEIIGVSENTVKSRMRYALDHLRRFLDDYRDLAKVAP